MYLGLSRRALLDLQEIEAYSREQWGRKVAGEYLGAIEAALVRLRENPRLLRVKPQVSKGLCFYRVNRHWLVCALFEDSLFVLTVKHGSMDLIPRLAELEPHLIEEAAMLHRAYRSKKGKA